MTHPLDRLYRFETQKQWQAGAGFGFVFRETANGVGGLQTPGALIARSFPGTSASIAKSLLARDAAGRVIALNTNGDVLALENGRAIRVAHIPSQLAKGAQRLIWGQRFAWIHSDGDLIRLSSTSGQRMGSFSQRGWHINAIAADHCDGVIIVETHSDKTIRRVRRLRSDGVTHPKTIAINTTGQITAARSVIDDKLLMVLIDALTWQFVTVDFKEGAAIAHAPFKNSHPKAGSPIAQRKTGAVVMVDASGEKIFEAGQGQIGQASFATSVDGKCRIGRIDDLLESADGLLASTETGLWQLNYEHDNAAASRMVWFSPILRSPLGERSGWQRADLLANAPKGAEITMASIGFSSLAQAESAREVLLDNPIAAADDTLWSPRSDLQPRAIAPSFGQNKSLSRHYGEQGVGQLACRHYLGDISQEYLLLRITVEVPACEGPVALDSLRILYPDRSLIEHLPAIYQDGNRAEKQVRRALAGMQALVDEIDDKITDAVDRVDPAQTDAVWSSFLLSWLGHKELARLPVSQRKALLLALPQIMSRRGTLEGLRRVMEIVAPAGFEIVDPALGPADWLLASAKDTAGARLGRDTRIEQLTPSAWQLGKCQPLGQQPLGVPCSATKKTACSSDVIVRVFGGASIETSLQPFTTAIARAFVPANARVHFLFSDHQPLPGLGFGAGLGEITLGPDGSQALGAWTLPESGSSGAPEQVARLDHSQLNGNLVLE